MKGIVHKLGVGVSVVGSVPSRVGWELGGEAEDGPLARWKREEGGVGMVAELGGGRVLEEEVDDSGSGE